VLATTVAATLRYMRSNLQQDLSVESLADKVGFHATAYLLRTFRCMAFNVLAKNCDDHSKNVSFLLKQGVALGTCAAYDLTYAYTLLGEWNEWTNSRVMSVNGIFSNITSLDLLEVAEQFGIGTASRELDRVVDAVRR
jgi:serine/threonine-protein kinase HipA